MPPAVRAIVSPLREALLGTLRGRGPAQAFAQSVATQILVIALNVATGVLTARLLGPEGRGVLAALVLWPHLFASLALAGVTSSLVFHMRTASPQEVHRVLTAGLVLGGACAAVGAAIGAVLVPQIMADRYAASVIALAVVATLGVTFLDVYTVLLRNAFVALGRVGTANASGWANPALYLVLLLGISATGWLSGETAALGMFAAGALTLAFLCRQLALLWRADTAGLGAWLRRLGAYARRGAPGDAMLTVSAHADRIVLVALIPAAEFGLYAVAYSFSRLLRVIDSGVAYAGLPAMAGRPAAEAKALHDPMFRFVLHAVALGALGALLLGEPALRLLYGAEFAAGAPFLYVLVAEAALGCLGTVLAQLYLASDRPGFLSAVQACSCAVLVVALLILVPLWGALGAAVALAIGAGVRLLGLGLGVKLVLGLRLPRITLDAADLHRLRAGLRRA
ncbi:lipopolysaccharide biosynthesis protein [Falsiroseomonas sp.]|uniref:lipopolysaccharide biosynthesis protein n=1 Tax=Falsiroseomonas sp. TaxID=2870721 RepID=UPI00356599B8